MTNNLLHRLRLSLGLGKRPPTAPLESTALNPSALMDITDADFAEQVLQADRLVVVDFWAEWCQPCQIMSAYVSFLAKDFGDQIVLTAMDVDENPETPSHYNIMGLPTLLLVKDGTVVDQIVGIEPYETIRDRVAIHTPQQTERKE